MNNIFDGLQRLGYAAESEIESAEPILQGIRLLTLNSDDGLADNVAYVSPSDAFLSPGRGESEGSIICSKNDIIFIKDVEPERVYNECIRLFEKYNHWEIELLKALIDDRSLDEFIQIGHKVFDNPMFISGSDDKTYAITRQYAPNIHPIWRHRLEEDSLDAALAVDNQEGNYFTRMFSSRYPLISYSPIWGDTVLFANLRNQREKIGHVMVYQYNSAIRKGDVHLMNVFANIIEKVLILHQNQFFPMSDLEDTFHRILGNYELDAKKTLEVLKKYHWNKDATFQIICAEFPSGTDSIVMARSRELIKQRFSGICAVLNKGAMVLLLNLEILDNKQEVIEFLESVTDKKYIFGSSMLFGALANSRFYYEQATRAVREAILKGKKELTFEDIYGETLQEYIDCNTSIKAMVHYDVGKLHKIDSESGSEYCKTLYVYLLCGCNYRKAASQLSLHRNTLLYRINRITEILECDFDDILYRQLLLTSLVIQFGFLA